jgi:saccharopine dehydrogenase (NAD+, L-lysine forming)
LYDLGIRRETKNRWERRAPLTPQHVEELVREQGRTVAVQPSELRVFADDDYLAAGAALAEDLAGARVILGIKEVPPAEIVPGRPHLAFFHLLKGQERNLPILRRALETGATLIDYEPIVDRQGRRLLYFGRQAGHAGMIDALWTLGRRLAAEGIDTPFTAIRQATAYSGLEEALDLLAGFVGREIRERGLPPEVHPLVVGVTGGGNVARGVLEVLDRLPVVEVLPEELAGLAAHRELSHRTLYRVVFRREARRRFERHLAHLTVLVNGIYWEPGDPRLVTWEDLAALWDAPGPPRLRVLADLSCDVGGSIEATVRATDPGDPVYVAEPATRRAVPGVEGRGPVVSAVDNLPAELPREASEHFGDSLFPFLTSLAEADFGLDFEHLALPAALLEAVVSHRGELTPRFRYLARFLDRVQA